MNRIANRGRIEPNNNQGSNEQCPFIVKCIVEKCWSLANFSVICIKILPKPLPRSALRTMTDSSQQSVLDLGNLHNLECPRTKFWPLFTKINETGKLMDDFFKLNNRKLYDRGHSSFKIEVHTDSNFGYESLFFAELFSTKEER
uniref:Uncharacterized protein n=1 Tax=Romanomermis culicivorax TaxID=13658 RepID=A0A915L5D8_ROMCU